MEIPLEAMEAGGELPDPSPAPPAPAPDPEALDQAATLLRGARRAAIVLGGGAADAGDEALELARTIAAPVITTASW